MFTSADLDLAMKLVKRRKRMGSSGMPSLRTLRNLQNYAKFEETALVFQHSSLAILCMSCNFFNALLIKDINVIMKSEMDGKLAFR